jgi:hypothetical protein
MKRCSMCGEQPLERLWREASGVKPPSGLCFLCAQEREMKDRYVPGRLVRTALETCERCGEISSAVRLTASGWLCGDCKN